MEQLTILIIIFIIASLVGVVSYIAYDVQVYKKDTNAAIATEVDKRSENVSDIVDQTNTTNIDTSKQVSENLNAIDKELQVVKSTQEAMSKKLEWLLGKKDSMEGIIEPNASGVRFIKPLSTANGLTVENARFVNNRPLNSFAICNESQKCIQVPDTNGDTYITTLVPNKSIIMDGKVVINNDGNKKLQFKNDARSQRHIVLWEAANNEQQFYGFGMNQNTIRYQVASSSSSHVFAAGIDGNESREIMRMTGQGFVGIGTPYPRAPLHIDGGTSSRNFSTFMITRNDQAGNPSAFSISIGDSQGLVNMLAGAYSVDGVHKYYNARGASRVTMHDGLIAFFTGAAKGVKDNNVYWKEVARISQDKFGILTTDPQFPLDVEGIAQVHGIIQNPAATIPMVQKKLSATPADRVGISYEAQKMRMYTTGADGRSALCLSKALSGNTYQDLVTVDSAGRVGIGLPNPLDALDVNGNGSIRGDMYVGRGVADETVAMRVGAGRTSNGISSMELVGDTQYRQYGTRIIRYPGGSGISRIEHNGNGALDIVANHSAPIFIRSNNKQRITIHPDGRIEIDGSDGGILLKGDITVDGNMNVMGYFTSRS